MNTESTRVVLLGLPTDEESTFAQGAALAPGVIREALHCDSSNLWSEAGVDLGTDPRWEDVGDLDLEAGGLGRQQISSAVSDYLAADRRVLCLGGDHAVAYPILESYGKQYDSLTVVQVDAHPDLYDHFEGNRFSHACPFARVMEEGRVSRLVQIGIRTLNAHQRAQAERFGVEIVPRCEWTNLSALELEGPTYLSIDLDGLDPAFAPGVSHLESGGLTVREVLGIIEGVPGLVGADVVELNPNRDVGGITAALAAKLTKELLSRLME